MKSLKNKIRMRNKAAFTLIELITAIGVLVMVVGFASIIFRTSIEGYRTASANSEIMQKLQTITTQLNRDFQNLPKNGFLQINTKEVDDRAESEIYYKVIPNINMDSIYYLTTGDFQSWFDDTSNPDVSYPRSNAARIYFGHDSDSLVSKYFSKWSLVRDVLPVVPGIVPPNQFAWTNESFSEFRIDPNSVDKRYNTLISNSIPINIKTDPDSIRSLLCKNAGELQISWTDGTIVNNSIQWKNISEQWNPWRTDWPKAIKFTFTLYDSKGILKGGRPFTHIVYLGN